MNHLYLIPLRQICLKFDKCSCKFKIVSCIHHASLIESPLKFVPLPPPPFVFSIQSVTNDVFKYIINMIPVIYLGGGGIHVRDDI